MKSLTHEQAETLRGLRPTVRPCIEAFAAFGRALRSGRASCGHEDTTPGCPACELEEDTDRIECALLNFQTKLDKALLAGPHPLAAERMATTRDGR